MSQAFAPPRDLDAIQVTAWRVGLGGLLLSLVGWGLASTQFYRSYLIAWLFWLGITLGCYAMVMLHQLTRGAWGLMIRRMLGAAMRLLPWMAVGLVPIVLGLDELYPWARPEVVAQDELIREKTWYLNRPGFVLRGVVYFSLLWLFSWVVNSWSLLQDTAASDRVFRRLQMVAAPGLGVYVLVATFASVDWLMSLDPHWYSSLYGVIFIGGHAVSALAFVIPVALYLSQREPLQDQLQPSHFHDYGKLLLAFVMLWAYFQLSQLIIVWSGNLPEEVTWYIARTEGGFTYLAAGIAIFHFALPFLLLLSRDLKRDARKLAVVAGLVLVMRWFDLYWHAAPTFEADGQPVGLSLHWLDLATTVGVGGVWVALYIRELKTRPLLPRFEPFLKEALEDE